MPIALSTTPPPSTSRGPGAIRKAARDEHRGGGNGHVHADGEAELASAPAEFVNHRLERETDGETRPAAHEEDEKAGGENKRGAGRELLRQLNCRCWKSGGVDLARHVARAKVWTGARLPAARVLFYA